MADRTLLWIVVAILIVGWVLGWFASFGIPAPNFGAVPSQPSTATTGQCAINPSIVAVETDAANPGTSFTPTNYYRLNGVYIGTTSPTTVGTVDVLSTNTSMLNVIKSGVALTCGSNLITTQGYAVANATETIYSNTGLLALTNNAAGGAYNETAAGAGGTYNWKIHMQGTDKKSTGDMLFIVELSSPANVQSVSLSGATSTTVPNGYTRQGTNSYVAAFIVPAIVGNTAVDHNLAVAAASSQSVTGAVYTTTYSMQPFIETDGTFNTGTAAFNSLNSAKYATSQTYNFFIHA